ncbi:MAG: hypothetical protein ABIF89_02515 [bacterium]
MASNTQDMMHPKLKALLEVEEKACSPEKKIWIGGLKDGDIVVVKTRNTFYKLEVIDSEDHLVEAESSRAPDSFVCLLGRLHVLGPIVKNYRLSLEATERNEAGDIMTINTSTVEKISVNDQEIT